MRFYCAKMLGPTPMFQVEKNHGENRFGSSVSEHIGSGKSSSDAVWVRPASTCVDPDTPTPGLGKKTKKLPEPPGELQVETVFQCILNITTKLLDTHITAPG